MCTIVLAWQLFEEYPVLVAANRDEALDRPADPPAIRNWGCTVLAPRDERAGGTWIGYNEHGVVVALTNRWSGDHPEGDRSRGLLVRDALGHSSAEDAIRFVETELNDRQYEPFNLLAADRTASLLVEFDGDRRIRPLDPGVHVVVNVGADGAYTIPDGRQGIGETQAANATALRTALTPEPGEGGRAWLDRAGETIADHEYGVCVHRDGFGTRSSTLLALGETEGYWYVDGPPCSEAFERVDEQILE